MPFKHPVTAVIVTCGLSHPKFEPTMRQRAHHYIRHMQDMAERMSGQLSCHIEQVVRFEEQVMISIDPLDYFDVESLNNFFKHHAIFLPFQDCGTRGVVPILRQIMLHISHELNTLMEENLGVARYDPVWKAFQLELCAEEIIYGHPLSAQDYELSVSLGTNTVSPKSLSQRRGFIGLSPHSSASAGEAPPPLGHFTRDHLQTLRLQRVFPLCQALDSSPAVIGSALIRVLLGDLFKRNVDIPYAAMKGRDPPGKLVGAWQLEVLAQDLADKDAFPIPNTFGRARQILRNEGKNVEESIVQGFLDMKLNFFPALKFRDTKGSKKLTWNFRDYVQVHASSCDPFPLSVVACKTLEVCTEVERRSLMYSRTVEKYREHGMPWMEGNLKRLPPQMKDTPNILLRILTFCSCVGFIQNGDYVDYQHMRELLTDMSWTHPQRDLQKMQIQSRFSLPRVFNMVVFKLHEDLPVRLNVKPLATAKLVPTKKPPPEEIPEEDVQDIDPQDDLRPLERSQSMCHPAHTSRPWSAAEIQAIPLDFSGTHKNTYLVYTQNCKDKRLLIRTFDAYKCKVKDLRKKSKKT